MRSCGFLAITALVVLASGCALEPKYHRPPAPVSTAFPTGAAYQNTAAGPGSSTLAASDIGWRDFLADPRLRRLVEIALRNNRDLRVAVLNVANTQAQYRVQRAQLFPQLSAFANGSDQRFPPNVSFSPSPFLIHDYTVGGSVSWEIDLFGRLRSLKDASLERYFSTAYARQATEILLVSQVADQYLTVLAFDEELEVTRQTLETARASYKIVKLQFDTGTGTELAVRQAETVVEQAQANYASQVRSRAQAENALVLLLGQPLPADLPAPTRMGEQTILTDIPAGLPSDLLTRRPDILEAEATLRSQNANIGAARAAFFPSISLTGNYGTSSATLGGLFGANSQSWLFAPSITVPVFAGGQNVANLKAAKVQRDIAIAQYEKAIQTAFREVSDGLAARGTYDEQVAALERYTAAQQRRLDLSQLRFNQGVDTYLSVLTAQTDLYTAQLSLVAARQARLTALVDLYRTLGGGWLQHTGEQPRPADIAAQAGAAPSR